MRKLRVSIITLFALGLAPTAFAKTDHRETRIARVYSSTTQLLIRLESGQSGEGCSSESWALIEQGAANPNALQMLEIATAAYLSGRTVDVRLNGCAPAAAGAYPKVAFIEMH